jgi:hypothetical protein
VLLFPGVQQGFHFFQPCGPVLLRILLIAAISGVSSGMPRRISRTAPFAIRMMLFLVR